MTISIIGAGNVAYHLALGLYHAGHKLSYVYARNISNAQEISSSCGAKATSSISDVVYQKVDIIIIATTDTAIAGIADQLNDFSNLVIHTAGSVGLDTISKHCINSGVLYPLQTFNKQKAINWQEVPLFIEASNTDSMTTLSALAHSLSPKIKSVDSNQRLALHIAAVFACNYSNALYGIAANICEENGLIFNDLLPLINETAHKLELLSPKEAQTGPAKRGDKETMDKHLHFLSSVPTIQQLYADLARAVVK